MRWRLLALLVGVLALLVSICLGLRAFLIDYSSVAKGSPEYAERWRESFEEVAGPDEAKAATPDMAYKRYPNGEWVFGVCRCSHRYRDGGTIVVKDSKGRVRAFFGHVCGHDFLESILQ